MTAPVHLVRTDVPSKVHRVIFVTGVLITIPLASTVAVLLLRRMFPGDVWPNFLGPIASALAVLWFVKNLNRRQ